MNKSTHATSLSWRRIDAVGDDLVREREGHCSAIIRLPSTSLTPQASDTKSTEAAYHSSSSSCDVVVVLGGYVEGSYEPEAIGAVLPLCPSRLSLLRSQPLRDCGKDCSRCNVGSLCWKIVGRNAAAFETDGATLTPDASRGSEQLFLFGGLDGETYGPRNSLYVLSWIPETTGTTGSTKMCESPESRQCSLSARLATCGGEIPSPRWRHAAASDNRHQMFVFGGATHEQSETNDLFAFDMTTYVWTRIDHVNAVPSPLLGPVFLPALIAWRVSTPPPGCGSHGRTSAMDSGTTTDDGAADEVVLLALYGGARFVDGVQSSVADMYLLAVLTGEGRDGLSSTSSAALLLGSKCVASQSDDAAAAATTGHSLPRVNGHVGVALPTEFECASTTAICTTRRTTCTFRGLFLCGKDFDEGSDSVIEIRITTVDRPSTTPALSCAAQEWFNTVTASVVLHDGVDGGPHWRYTPSCAAIDVGPATASRDPSSSTDVFILGGQCRHPDPVSVYALHVA